MMVIVIAIDALGTVTKVMGNKSMREYHQNYSIINIGQNTEKTWGGLLSLKYQWKTIS